MHTLNGSALAWARVWAALVEWGRRPDGSVALPGALAPYFGADLVLVPRALASVGRVIDAGGRGPAQSAEESKR